MLSIVNGSLFTGNKMYTTPVVFNYYPTQTYILNDVTFQGEICSPGSTYFIFDNIGEIYFKNVTVSNMTHNAVALTNAVTFSITSQFTEIIEIVNVTFSYNAFNFIQL